MNFQQLVEQLFQFTGHPDPSSDRPDYLTQQFRDAINSVTSEICSICAPQTFALVREAVLPLVAGQNTYFLSDWCQRALSLYFTDPSSGFTYDLKFRRPRNADMDGSRNPNLVVGQLGRFQVTLAPRTAVAQWGSAAGSQGASAAEGTQVILLGNDPDLQQLPAAAIGCMIKLNGDYGDYLIQEADVNANIVVVDRPVRSRVSGLTTTGVGPGYGASANPVATPCKYEVSPKGRYRVQFLPVPTIVQSINYRYMALPRKLLSDDDEPEILEEYHHLIYKGACLKVAASKENQGLYQIYQQEFNDAMAEMRKSDIDDVDSTDAPQYETLGSRRAQYDLPPGTLCHGQSAWGFGNY